MQLGEHPRALQRLLLHRVGARKELRTEQNPFHGRRSRRTCSEKERRAVTRLCRHVQYARAAGTSRQPGARLRGRARASRADCRWWLACHRARLGASTGAAQKIGADTGIVPRTASVAAQFVRRGAIHGTARMRTGASAASAQLCVRSTAVVPRGAVRGLARKSGARTAQSLRHVRRALDLLKAQ